MKFTNSLGPVWGGLVAGLWLALVFPPGLSSAQRGGDQGMVRPAYAQWTTYLNPKFAYQVPVPPGLRAQSDPRKGGSCRFILDDGGFALRVWGSTLPTPSGDPLEEAWREAVNLRGRRIDFQRRARTGFVLAGANADGTEFYEKIILGNGATAGVNLSYPSSLAPRFAPWVDEIERGFIWHEGGGPLVRGGEPPRRGIFGDLRNYFTGENEEVPSRWSDPVPDPADPNPGSSGRNALPGQTSGEPNKTRIDLTPPPPAPPGNDPTGMPLEKSATPPASSTVPKPVPAKREDLPFGIAIPGKKGYVYSPYVDNKQQVDVTDIPTGTKVKCPYTGKVFRVP